MIDKVTLEELYNDKNKSMLQISKLLGCSPNKVTYWMDVYGIKRRTIADAVYVWNHPDGDPFHVREVLTDDDLRLMGMGLGLYWGEGNKANKTSIRLGNTDPELLKTFILFLVRIFSIDKKDLKFNLQIFTDININEALEYWINAMGVDSTQFYRPTVTVSGSIGTYKKKSQYGVLSVYRNPSQLNVTEPFSSAHPIRNVSQPVASLDLIGCTVRLASLWLLG